MKSLAALLLALAFAWATPALAAEPAIIHGHAASLGATLRMGYGAQQIVLDCGDYGDVVIKYGPANITGTPCAVFHSLSVQAGGSGSNLNGFSIVQTPGLAAIAPPALKIIGSALNRVHDVTATNLTIHGGLALVGVMPDSDPTAPGFAARWAAVGQNVLGWPTGSGVGITWADNVTIAGLNISVFDKGLGAVYSRHVTVRDSEIHHVRTSMIVGASDTDLTIAHNWLHDTNPWNPLNNGAADHADFIHLWNVKGQVPFDGLTVSDNQIDEADGKPTIGIHLDDQKTGLGFTNLQVVRNTIIDADNQGMRFENVHGAAIGNVLLQPAGGGKTPRIVICTDPKYCAPSTITQSANASTAWPASAAAIARVRAPATPGLARPAGSP